MSNVVSIRLQDNQLERLKYYARRMGKSQSEMGAQFIEESMREAEFSGIEFRDSVLGRHAYMADSNLGVWEVILIAQDHDMDASKVESYFKRSSAWVNAAFSYYEAFHVEINHFIQDNRSTTFTKLKRLLPSAEMFVVTAADTVQSHTD